MQFAHPTALALLLFLPLLHRFWLKRQRPPAIRFSHSVRLSPEMASHPRASVFGKPWALALWVQYLAFLFLVLAMMRPQNRFQQSERTTSGIEIMVVLDVSASMNIEDLAERSRLEVAKDTIEKFIQGRGNDRIGFVIFSGEALTMAPPTLDYGMLLNAVHQASIGILRDGTAIGDGLALTINHLRSSEAKSRIIILLTDGDNNLGQVDPVTAGELAEGYHMKVYTIAIGREGRVKMPVRHRGAFGNVVTSYQWFDNALNPELLQQIAKRTAGKFYRVTDESTLDSVFQEIDHLEKSDVKQKEHVRWDEQYARYLQIALVLFLGAQFLQVVWTRGIP